MESNNTTTLDDLITLCPECGTEMKGLPWEKRDCPACRIFMPPYFGHPQAPEELRERYKAELPHIAKAFVEAMNTDDMLEKMRQDRIRRAE